MKKIVIAITFVLVSLLLSYNASYAAVIESKDSTGQVVTGGTISDFYVMAEGLKGTGQGLEGTSVDVKMANNYEWAAVSYFSNSAYGTGGTGGNTGTPNINTGVAKHKSTNGNVTGVMDWGNNITFTAGITESYKDITLTTEGGDSIKNAANNPNTSDKIDKFPIKEYNDDVAQTGWYTSKNINIGSASKYPYALRYGMFGFVSGHNGGTYGDKRSSGKADGEITFRAVFYAQ